MKQKFTISVVSHGHGDLLSSLLEDVSRFVPTAETIVTFNIPETFDTARWPEVKFLYNDRPRGFGANHNSALANSKHDWLVIVNPDVRLTETTFPAICAAINGGPMIDLFAPQVVGPNGNLEDSARALPTPVRVFRRAAMRLAGRAPQWEPAELTSWFAGMFLVVRRSTFNLVNGFDERFFLYGEDVALAIRLVADKHRLRLVRDAIVIHDARRATLRSFRHLRWHAASLIRLWMSPNFYLHERRYLALENESSFDA
jgi:N-acetylglucosaminyl-diphospho-decaprenol L-rhamnosyltransferase